MAAWLSNKLEAFRFVLGFFLSDPERRAAEPPGLQVIGAGFSRTGTQSMAAALERLGHKIYDTRAMAMEGGERWVAAAREIRVAENYTLLDGLLLDLESRGYTATQDYPINMLASSIALRRPKAKVLMTVRKTTHEWMLAWRDVNAVMGIMGLRPVCWLLNFNFTGDLQREVYGFEPARGVLGKHYTRPLPWYEVFHAIPGFSTEEELKEWEELHDRHRRKLESELPKDRFLVFHVSSGWRPLLDFLGVDDPALAKEPFPWVNDKRSLEVAASVVNVISILLPLWAALLLCCPIWCLRRLGKRVSSAVAERKKLA